MNRIAKREKRHLKVRKNVEGTSERPRLSVFKSNRYIYAQIIDDRAGKTLAFESDVKASKKGTKTDSAYEVGKNLAAKAGKISIKAVVFDRGGFLYHGRIAKVAQGAREGGLKF